MRHLKLGLGRGGLLKAAALLLIAGNLAACATGPTYRPRGPNESVGYTDQRLTENRFRVTFSGGVGTQRQAVEDYLLRRAAEVTLQSGYTHFVFDARDTEATEYYQRSPFYPRSGFGAGFGPRYYNPHWWYYSSFGFGDPFFRDPFYDRDFPPQRRYQAYSEIVTLRPEQAANEPDAIDARQLLADLPPLPAPPPTGS